MKILNNLLAFLTYLNIARGVNLGASSQAKTLSKLYI